MSDRTEQLGECEAWYVAEVTGHVRRLPDAGALDAAGGAAGQPLGAAAVGEPRRAARCARVASRLRRPTPSRRGAAGRGARPRRRWSLRRVGLGLAVVAVVLAGWFAWRWWTAEPGIYNSCAGVTGQPPEVTVEQRDAAGSTEHLVGYADGAELSLLTCLSSRGSRDHRRRRARHGRVHAVRAHGPPQARGRRPPTTRAMGSSPSGSSETTVPTACSSCTSTVGSPTASTTRREAATRSPTPR